MKRPIIDKLLDALDTSANSNTFWLSFEIANEESFNLPGFLIHQLKSKIFHYEMIKQDLERGWNMYSEMVLPKDWKNPTFVQRPGNIWNGNTELDFDKISENKVKDLLIDLLTGQQKYFTRSGLGSPIPQDDAKSMINELMIEIKKNDKDWIAYNLKPNFLNLVNDALEKDGTILPYFEGKGRDLALGFQINDQFHLLLTNGYS